MWFRSPIQRFAIAVLQRILCTPVIYIHINMIRNTYHHKLEVSMKTQFKCPIIEEQDQSPMTFPIWNLKHFYMFCQFTLLAIAMHSDSRSGFNTGIYCVYTAFLLFVLDLKAKMTSFPSTSLLFGSIDIFNSVW